MVVNKWYYISIEWEGAISSLSPSVKSQVTSDTVPPPPNSTESEGPHYVPLVGSKIAQEKTEDSNSD